jgi:RNA polymerase sigma-70 factor (ECF subfamily)
MDRQQHTFEALVQAYSADLYRYAFWLCHNAALAEDLVQETFMRAWKAIDTLNDPASVKSWLLTILRRENARHFARADAHDLPLETLDLDTQLGLADETGNTEHFVLRQALASLPLEYREPLLLQVLAGYSCDEIADMLNLQSGAVMTRLSRARQKLRTLMTGDESGSTRNTGG